MTSRQRIPAPFDCAPLSKARLFLNLHRGPSKTAFTPISVCPSRVRAFRPFGLGNYTDMIPVDVSLGLGHDKCTTWTYGDEVILVYGHRNLHLHGNTDAAIEIDFYRNTYASLGNTAYAKPSVTKRIVNKYTACTSVCQQRCFC